MNRAPAVSRRHAAAALVGLGFAGMTRAHTPSAGTLAAQAVDAAIEDAGLRHRDIDGLLVSRSGGFNDGEPDLRLQGLAGLPGLRLLQEIYCEGTSALQMIATAAAAVGSGAARHVACVFADAPLHQGTSGRAAFSTMMAVDGVAGLRYSAGAFGGAANYALSARRHMHEHGLTECQLGAVAVSTRAWAALNPRAVLRTPLTLDAYLAARFIVEPLRLLDCAIPVNGGIAVIVSATDIAGGLQCAPVYVHGTGQGHRRSARHRDTVEPAHVAAARDQAFGMAGIGIGDIDVREFYDAFTFMTIATLESYGFCAKGEGGVLAHSGVLGPGGALPTNTGGGHLSGYYLQGMTPVSEAIIQARGDAGERQCARRDVILVTNEGGWFDHHACMIVSPHRTLA